MTNSFVFDKKVPKAVVEAFVPHVFSGWQNVADFTLDQIQKHVGAFDDANFTDFFERTQQAVTDLDDGSIVSAYQHLMVGAVHLSAIKHPFPYRTSPASLEEAAQVVIASWGVGLRMSAIYETLDTIREEGIDTDQGKEALDTFFGHVKLLKEIAPTTKLNTLWTGIPPVSIQPRVRGRLNELAVLALSGNTGFTVAQGQVVSLQ